LLLLLLAACDVTNSQQFVPTNRCEIDKLIYVCPSFRYWQQAATTTTTTSWCCCASSKVNETIHPTFQLLIRSIYWSSKMKWDFSSAGELRDAKERKKEVVVDKSMCRFVNKLKRFGLFGYAIKLLWWFNEKFPSTCSTFLHSLSSYFI